MHPSLRMIAPALTAALLSACFDFDATMAGGPLDASGPVTVSDATVPDGSRPLGSNDASVDATDGGSSEAGIVADSGGSYCSLQTPPAGGFFFCDDFDESTLPGSWDNWFESAGTLVDTDASAVSPPSSVVETTTALAYGQTINVALRTTFAGVPVLPATLSFAFSVEPVQIDITANAAIVLGAIDFLDGAGDRYSIGLAINVANGQPALALGEQSGVISGGNFPDGGPPYFVNHPLPPTEPLLMNTWSNIVIELDWTASGLEGKVSVNGGNELGVQLTMTVVPSSLQIGVGTSYVTEYEDGGPSPIWELRYDNVLFTAN